MGTIERLKQLKLKEKIFSFFSQTKLIGGLAITDKSLVLAFRDEKGNLIFKESPIKSLNKKIDKSLPSLIVSLPPNLSFTQVFEFPLIATEEQIQEAMELADSTLPLPKSGIYTDWMFLESKKVKKRETVLALAKKALIDSYLKILEDFKAVPIAVETYSWSLGRFLEEGDKIVMTIMELSDDVAFAVYDGQTPFFHFHLPKENLGLKTEKDKIIEHYTRRLIHYISAENYQTRIIDSIIVLNNQKLKEHLQKKIPGIEFRDKLTENAPENLDFLIALGAMKRGLIPRRSDTVISLMPMGTELAYSRHRLFSFVDFIQKFLIGFGAFLTVLFLATLIMIEIRFSGVKKELEEEMILPLETTMVKEKAREFNDLVSKATRVYSLTPDWEKLFGEIDNYGGVGIAISGISVDLSGGAVQFSGTAVNRDALIVLKNKLVNSAVFETEPLPLSLFLSSENIPFTVKMKLKISL